MDRPVSRKSAGDGACWHALTVEETRRRLDTSIEKGLDAREAQTRLQEFGPDTESHDEFTWAAPAVTIAVDFAPTEAVERYRIGKITPCACAAD